MRLVNGDPRHSDHRPIIIHTENQRMEHMRHVGDGGFKFEAKWLMEDNYKKEVGEAWSRAMERGDVTMKEAVKTVVASLSEWNRNGLGDLEKRIKKTKKDLENIRRGGIGQEVVAREAVLRYKLGEIRIPGRCVLEATFT